MPDTGCRRAVNLVAMATTGYDLTTGLGSIDGYRLYMAMETCRHNGKRNDGGFGAAERDDHAECNRQSTGSYGDSDIRGGRDVAGERDAFRRDGDAEQCCGDGGQWLYERFG